MSHVRRVGRRRCQGANRILFQRAALSDELAHMARLAHEAAESALLAHHDERCAAHCVRIGRLIRLFHTGVPLSAQSDDE